MAVPVSLSEMLNPATGDSLQAGRSLAQNIAQSNLANQVAPTQMLAPAQKTNFGNASNAFGLMSSGFSGIGQSLEAPEQRRVAQANLDAQAARQAEQTNYNRGVKANEFQRLLQGDARQAAQDKIKADDRALTLFEGDAGRQHQIDVDAIGSKFLQPTRDAQDSNKGLIASITQDPNMKLEVDPTTGETSVVPVVGEGETASDALLEKVRNAESSLADTTPNIDESAVRKELEAYAAKVNSDKSTTNNMSADDVTAELTRIMQGGLSTGDLNPVQDMVYQGELEANKLANAEQLKTLADQYTLQTQNMPVDTKLMQDFDLVTKEQAQFGPNYDATAAFYEKNKDMLGNTGKSNMQSDVKRGLEDAKATYGKGNKFVASTESGKWNKAHEDLVMARALNRLVIDTASPFFGWTDMQGKGGEQLTKLLREEMDFVNKNIDTINLRRDIDDKFAKEKEKLEKQLTSANNMSKFSAQRRRGNVVNKTKPNN